MSDQIDTSEMSLEDQMAAAMAAEMAADQPQAQAYQPDDVATMSAEPMASHGGDLNLNAILDIPVKVTVEIGRTQVPIRDLMQYNPGSVVELERLVGEPLDVLVNGTLVAKGEVVVVNERFGIRLTDVVNPAERFKKLK
ncbi:flagellar motor switch protein FliN [Porticoccaceae bacterium LTM1]|nr:flagellar motor switch protein FliN [Porticoccaceae bacterium LTM1]